MNLRSSILYAAKLIVPRPALSFKRAGAERSNGRRSLLGAMLCIGISLVPLIAVLVVSDGMIQGITGRMINLSSQDINVQVSTQSKSVTNLEELRELGSRLGSIEGVTACFPEVQGMALAAGSSSRIGATVRAMETDIFKDSEFSSLFSVVEGSMDFPDPKSAVIGQKIASDLGVHAGDKIRLISVNQVRNQMVPKVAVFTVSGIVSCGYQELDAVWVFIPIESGFTSIALKSAHYVLGLRTRSTFSPELLSIREAVTDELYGYNSGDKVEFASVYTWDTLNAAQYENFSSTKILLLLIMLLIVLVASVNISSALVMIVMERRREIAILKSVGASPGGIATAFLMVGLGSGFGGVLMGLPLGLLAAVNINGIIRLMEQTVNLAAKFFHMLGNHGTSGFQQIHLLDPAYYLQEIPVSIPLRELSVIVVGTLLLSLLVSVVPALKAGREKPLDTLRKM